MIFSYSQISQFLACPRRYRYRYLDGWRERDNSAGVLFGRAFELGITAYFSRDDAEAVFAEEWSRWQAAPLRYSARDSWDRMFHDGRVLLQRFAQDDRVRIANPENCLQIKVTRRLSGGNSFIGYIDALGTLDGKHCVLDWKTTGARYAEDPPGLLALDPQLICYSWLTGISEVALVVFVRKRWPEIQYLKTTITPDQRLEFAELVDHTIGQIQSGHFVPHPGIRYPANGCVNCPFLGLCMQQERLVETRIVRKPGAIHLDWIEKLAE